MNFFKAIKAMRHDSTARPVHYETYALFRVARFINPKRTRLVELACSYKGEFVYRQGVIDADGTTIIWEDFEDA